MTKISKYILDTSITDDDKILGSDGAEGSGNGLTKNFSVGDLKEHILADVKPGSIIADSSTIYSKTVTLTPEQLLGLNGGGEIEVLPQPESGKVYILKNFSFYLNFNTTPYNFLGNLELSAYNPNAMSTAPRWYFLYYTYLNGNEDIRSTQGDLAGQVIVESLPLYVVSPLFNTVTQGDSTVKISFQYQIQDMAL